ncbi:MAG: SRPBCC family protein [Cyanobacteria bacterium P01_C01_bin.73]
MTSLQVQDLRLSQHPLSEALPSLSKRDCRRLQQGQIVVTGQSGTYTIHGLVSAAPETAWSVLNDFSGFAKFLPTVVSSRVVESNGDRSVVEQVDQRKVFFQEINSTVRTENIRHDQQIDFHMIEGDLQQMEGFWRIDAIAADSENDASEQVLVTQKVSAQAGIGVFDGVFFKIFEGSVKENMKAICQEITRRD